MAMIRRGGQHRFNSSIWPGFVDAMTALLLVLMFVLTIFMIVQFILRETITDQDTQLNYLSEQVASLAEALGLEQQKSDGLETEVERLDGELLDATSTAEVQSALIATLSQQAKNQQARITEFEAQISSFEAQVASLLAEQSDLVLHRDALQGQVETATAENVALAARISEAEAENLRVMSEKEALQLALAKARDEIDEGTEAARLAAAKREALEALIAQTQASLAERETSLQAALAALADTRNTLGSTETNLSDIEQQLAKLAADLASSKAAHEDEIQSAAELQARLDVLEKGLSKLEKERLAIEAAAATLRARLDATQGDLGDEEKARLAEAAAAEVLRKRLADTQASLSAEEKAKLAEMAAAEALRKKLENLQAELTAMTLALEEKRKEAEDTLTVLAAAEVAKREVDVLLAAALLAKENVNITNSEAAERIATLEIQASALQGDKDALNDRLAAVIAQLETRGDEASVQLAEAAQNREELEERLAAALAAKLAAERDASVLLSKSEQRRVLLAQANDLLSDEKARSAEGQREIALLNQQTVTLRKQLNSLQALLDEAKIKDAEAQVQIETLGANLNIALAQVLAEQKRVADEQRRRAELEEEKRKRLEEEAKDLKKFKSEFFGKLRDLLGNREGVKIVGDRFVFSSEVLFGAGSTDLEASGKREIAKVASLIKDVAGQIPPEIDWILRVDGHTDNVPLSGTGEYQDNWELSQGRALAVVRYMIEELGMPSDRLAATGFGEYQPINPANTHAARAQNRRIELKFTER